MCDPVTAALLIGGTVAGFAGSGIQAGEAARNNARVAEARNKVLRETTARNLALAEKNRALLNSRVGEMAPENTAAALQTAQTGQTAALEGAIAPEAAVAPLTGDAPQVIRSELGKKLADTFARSKDRAGVLGKFGGYGAQLRDEAIADAGLGRGINTNNDFVAGNMRILPYLQDYAEYRATKPSSGLGQIIAALGGFGAQAAGARGLKAKPAPGIY